MENLVNTTTSKPRATMNRPKFFEKFAKNLVLRNLFVMSKGLLIMELPCGKKIQFGQTDYRGEFQAEIKVKSYSFFTKCLLFGDIGFGEAYTDGDWDTDHIDKVIAWFIHNIEQSGVISGTKRSSLSLNLMQYKNKLFHFFHNNTKSGSRRNIAYHYDLSNDFFKFFLDPSMTYSSAYFLDPDDTDLISAQYRKYQMLIDSLAITSSDHVLEIGCGWGGFSIYCAKKIGCKVTAVTISQRQYDFAHEQIQKEGLSDQISLKLCDYRDITGVYDKIVSIEMMEALGAQYVPTFFKKCESLLQPLGSMSVQVITYPDSRFQQLKSGVDWIQKYIFPGSLLLSVSDMLEHAKKAGSGLQLHSMKDFGLHYAKTLGMWYEQFQLHKSDVLDLGFDEYFLRMWDYYLKYCQAAFATRNISVAQLTFTKPNNTSLEFYL